MNQSDEAEITLQVCDPKIISGINKYIVYTIKGMDKNGQFDIQRRFSDFKTIRQFLLTKWPGCYIPPVPPKKAFGNMEQQFIDERREMLEDFLKRIATLKFLWYSEEFQIFLKTPGEIEKALLSIPKVTNDEIINKYQDTFSELSGREINREIIQKINDFKAFIKKVQPMVQNFKQIAKNIAEAKQSHQIILIDFIIRGIPQYENTLLLEYVEQKEKLPFTNIIQNEEVKELIDQYCELLKDPKLNQLYQEVRKEGKQLKAFLETFSEREKYEYQKANAESRQKELELALQEVLAGKTTIRTLFSKGKKDDNIAKLQYQITEVGKEIESYQFICDILTVLVGYVEIDKFKVEKQYQYYSMIKNIISYQSRFSEIEEKLWSKVLESEYLQQQQQ
ncbi:unnamed protein product [Paramecium octaurelia]|uniref:PX domain-containing protein n=1 Tax=Paramecium octaurelia TaxID=43137 RepID=A0A8S1SZX5_PAROT|nr:unnamed protein product [Paramecium octaurelia]